METKVFNFIERAILYSIVLGEAIGTDGVKIAKYRPRIEAKLREAKQDVPTSSALSAILRRGSNNQAVWNAVYQVVTEFRPGLFEKICEGET